MPPASSHANPVAGNADRSGRHPCCRGGMQGTSYTEPRAVMYTGLSQDTRTEKTTQTVGSREFSQTGNQSATPSRKGASKFRRLFQHIALSLKVVNDYRRDYRRDSYGRLLGCASVALGAGGRARQGDARTAEQGRVGAVVLWSRMTPRRGFPIR